MNDITGRLQAITEEDSRTKGPAIIQACHDARVLLEPAVHEQDFGLLHEIRNNALKARREAYLRRLGKDAQLATGELARRAERALAQAVREGQRRGLIISNGINTRFSLPGDPVPVTTFVSKDLVSGNEAGIYRLADGISDEVFELAVSQALEENQISRKRLVQICLELIPKKPGDEIPDRADHTPAAAVRRLELITQYAPTGMTSPQIAARIGIGANHVRRMARAANVEIPADAVLTRSIRPTSERIVRETAQVLDGLAVGIAMADASSLSIELIQEVKASYGASLRTLNSFMRKMRAHAHATLKEEEEENGE